MNVLETSRDCHSVYVLTCNGNVRENAKAMY